MIPEAPLLALICKLFNCPEMMLKLVEKEIATRAIIDNMAINNNVLTLNIHGITLEQASTMVRSLEESELVESASVYNAVAESAAEASIAMTIIMTKEAE